MNEILLSNLEHTWILDLDGTIVKHNGYKVDGCDSFLEGAQDFLNSIPEKDMVIFLTSRVEEYREITEKFLNEHGVRYNYIIFDIPYGERIIINDVKPSGLKMATAISVVRDGMWNYKIRIDGKL